MCRPACVQLLSPSVSTCFPFLFGASARRVTPGAEPGVGGGACVEMSCQTLFTPASSGRGHQPVAGGQPAITPPALHGPSGQTYTTSRRRQTMNTQAGWTRPGVQVHLSWNRAAEEEHRTDQQCIIAL